MRDLRLLDDDIEDEENFGITIEPDYLMDIYLNYHDHALLPAAGGTGDQDKHEMYSLRQMDRMVAWWIKELERDGKDDADDDDMNFTYTDMDDG